MQVPWPLVLLLISASLSATAGVLLVLGGESIGYVVVLGSVALAGFLLADRNRSSGRRD